MPQPPLNEKDLQQMNDNLEQLAAAKQAIKQATSAGLDVTALNTQVNEQQAQLIKLKQTYFPGK